jgi:hypothetical protein
VTQRPLTPAIGCRNPFAHMGRPLVAALTSIGVLIMTIPAGAEGDLKAGWTPKLLASEAADCTEATVRDAWENTKREQGADPATPLTRKIRKQLAPQIAAMKKLCACAIREAAKRYTRAEAEASPNDLQSFIAETVTKGTCTIEP